MEEDVSVTRESNSVVRVDIIGVDESTGEEDRVPVGEGNLELKLLSGEPFKTAKNTSERISDACS